MSGDRAAPVTVGVKHLIDCNCILPQFINRPRPIFHKFAVFSTVTNDVVDEKYAQCPNCGVIHHVTEIGKSEIMPGGKDSLSSVMQLDDIKLQLPDKIVKVLESYDVEHSTWEQALFLHSQKDRPYRLILSKEDVIDKNEVHGKVLHVNEGDSLAIMPFIRAEVTRP